MESFADALNGRFLRETSPKFASSNKEIRANQPTPIPTEIIKKSFQGERKSINPLKTGPTSEAKFDKDP